MNCCIFHSVNCGLYFWDGITGLFVDGIHDGAELGYSPMPDFLRGQLNRQSGLFAHTDGLLFTHLHRDHFQRAGVRKMLAKGSPPLVYGPGLAERSAPIRAIRPGLCRVQMAGAYILAKDTLHDGAQYINDPHQSYLIRMGGQTFFIAGDAKLSREDAGTFGQFYGSVDAAFFNLYQLSSPEGLDFLRLLAPGRAFLYHLPFREDDRFHYRTLARQIVRHIPADLPAVEILPHMQWLDRRAADWDLPQEGGGPHALPGVAGH